MHYATQQGLTESNPVRRPMSSDTKTDVCDMRLWSEYFNTCCEGDIATYIYMRQLKAA